jgi:cellulose synthase/poly-beta-1,6-N-acetylglucosamine synthase-like glycosyltransferase
MAEQNRPTLSVVVPAYRGEEVLPESLEALLRSDLPRDRWELIVVEDACPGATAEVAREYADRVIRLRGGPAGPAFARNRGAEVARGDILVFVDADVRVHRDTLRRFAELLAREPEVDAVFGAYDADPPDPGLVSQYRNLLHHYVHSRSAGEAETFWAGCGAVRRHAFVRVGGFDERTYSRPQVEDIDLGYRLRAAGCRILLRPEIQATHLKSWTLQSMALTDLRDRGIPWMRLLLRQGAIDARRATLNLSHGEKFCTALAGFAAMFVVAAAVAQNALWLLLAMLSFTTILVLNADLFRWFASVRGIAFATMVVPLRILYYLLNGVAAGVGLALHHASAPEPRRSPVLDRPEAPRP